MIASLTGKKFKVYVRFKVRGLDGNIALKSNHTPDIFQRTQAHLLTRTNSEKELSWVP